MASGLRVSMRNLLGLAAVAGALLLPSWTTQALARDSARDASAVKPRALKLPARAFLPAALVKSFVDPNSNNTDKTIWPRDEHSRAYTAFGRINGYYERARWLPAPGNSVGFEYDGSLFRSASGARAAWHDGSTHDLKFTSTKVLACPGGLGQRCARITVKFTGGRREVYDVIQQGVCLSEVRAKTKPAVLKSRRQTIYTVLAQIDRAAVNRMRKRCG